ncbi:MAG: winged helix-turn-helix domain-containing protein [Candidatus Zixiibacteriota bacterium]
MFRWYQAYQENGLEGLKPQPTPGRPPRLTPAQKEGLVKALLKGPLAAGYRTDLWTLQRVTEVIERRYGIQYHPSHVWKLLRSLGWSCQKPERRALQRDEKAIAYWKRYRWPHIKKRGKDRGPSGLS